MNQETADQYNLRLYSLDSDMPNFTATKYNSLPWRLWHGITYFLFSCLLLVTCLKESFKDIRIIHFCHIFASLFLLLSSFTEWFHFRRGCLGLPNLNSKFKSNRKTDCLIALKRSEHGIYYFLSFLSSCIFLLLSIQYIIMFYYHQNSTPPIILKSPEYIRQLYLLAAMLVFIAQLLKIGKITQNTLQYSYQKDLSNLFTQIFMMIGALCYIVGISCDLLFGKDLPRKSYNKNAERLSSIALFSGNISVFLSACFLLFRYFFSGYDDLNMDEMSFVTV